MNELTFYYLAGISIVPALIAFGATFFHKKGIVRPPVGVQRRLISALVIYAVCLATELVLTTLIAVAAVPNANVYESPFLIISGLLAYFAGHRVAFG